MGLSPELWQRLEPLLDEALDRPQSEREAWARLATEDEPELRQALLELSLGVILHLLIRGDLPGDTLGGGLPYLLRKHVLRHRRAWTLAAVLLLTASPLLASRWRERQRARHQLEIVATFSRLAERAENRRRGHR